MSERTAYDALPRNLPREVRSSVLAFEQAAAAQKFRYDKLHPTRTHPKEIDCELFEAEFDDNYNLVKVPPTEFASSSADGGQTKRSGSASVSSNVNGNRAAVASTSAGFITNLITYTKDVSTETRKEDIIEYEALSWRWGDERNGECAVMIHRAGALYRKRVSQTLGLALKYLRFEKDRILWIDAICINQEDDAERSSQVSMMSLVYTGAEQVCVWLGEDDEESTMAIRFIRNEIKGLKNFDQLCTDPKNAKKWGTLLGLMQRPWFSRRWVVQEVVLAREATVYCGPDKIPWRELAIAVELFVEVETATHRLSELMKKDEKYNLIPNWFEHISELGASLLVNATARVFRESRHGERALAQRSLLSLEYLVTSLSIFDCGRPHDSVYALVAVARDARPFAPAAFSTRTKEALVAEVCSHYLEQKPYVLDYHRPYADVCKDFVHFCVLRCASTDKIQALNILCRPWAKDWRPGEYNPRNSKDTLHEREANHADRPTLIKHKGAWKLRLLPPGGSEAEVNIEDLSDEDGLRLVDNRDSELYWNVAKIHSPIRPIIAKWFPSEIDEASNKESIEIAASRVGKKMSKRKKAKMFKNIPEVLLEIDVQKEHELSLPSWVAKITAAPFDIFPHAGMDMVKMGRKNADPLTGIPQDGHRNYSAGQTKRIDVDSLKFRRRPRCNHYSLYVKGFWFDTVEEVAQVSQGGAIPGTWLDLAGWSEARRPLAPGTELKDPPDEFWRTLVADRGRHDRNPPYYYARACRETIIKGGLQSGAVDSSAMIHNERNSIIAEFCRRVQSVIWNRALIRTESGALGLVSDKVREGDRICIIYGCTVPIILRKRGWKTQEEHELEEFEDAVEAMKSLMRKCENNRARKARWEEMKKTMDKKGLRKIRKVRRKYNDDLKPKVAEAKVRGQTYKHAASDNESEDATDEDLPNKVEAEKDEEEEEELERAPNGTTMTVKVDEGGKTGKTLNGERRPSVSFEKSLSGNRDSTGRPDVESEDPNDKTANADSNDTIMPTLNQKSQSEGGSNGVEVLREIAAPNSSNPVIATADAKITAADDLTVQLERQEKGKGREVQATSESEQERTTVKSEQEQITANPEKPPVTAAAKQKQTTVEIVKKQRHHSRANSTREDDIDDDEESDTKSLQRSNTGQTKMKKQKKANARDKYRHSEFFGEAYIHGMMDGEAVRQNLDNGKPDHAFEIR